VIIAPPAVAASMSRLEIIARSCNDTNGSAVGSAALRGVCRGLRPTTGKRISAGSVPPPQYIGLAPPACGWLSFIRQRLSNPHRSQRGRRPSDSRFPSLEVFECRPCLGGQQWSMKGRHPKTFAQAVTALVPTGTAATEQLRFSALRRCALGRSLFQSDPL
jgi:hypothetical protein